MNVSTSKLESVFTLLVELNHIFSFDETEHANLLATDILKRHLGANSVALFYEDTIKGFRFCLSGSDYPIELSEGRWTESLHLVQREEKVYQFTAWAPPGIDEKVGYWIALRLFGINGPFGYLLVGRNKKSWEPLEATVLENIAEIISNTVEFRMQRNITEQARASAVAILQEKEKKLRNLFDGSPDMIYTSDAEDIITEINYAGIKLLGEEKKEDLIGKNVTSFSANPEGRPYQLDRVNKMGSSTDNEIILRHKNGKAIFCIESITIIRDATGEKVGYQGIVKDITQRIMSERELWKSTLELVDANKKLQQTQALMVQHEKLASIGQLAAGVAHEINNPLGFLKSNQAMIEKYLIKIKKFYNDVVALPGPELEEIRKNSRMDSIFSDLETIAQESDDGFTRIIRIVTDLKSFSRIDQGTGFELVDINAGIESTLVVAWNEIKYVADVTKNFDTLPPVRARGNEINQVILNVLVNAAQAIQSQKRQDKGSIILTTSVIKDSVKIKLHDDGPGIPEEIQSRIFEPFFTTKEPGTGTGLGLSISYNIIVNKHGGRFYIDSKVSPGTTFIIELPINGPPGATI